MRGVTCVGRRGEEADDATRVPFADERLFASSADAIRSAALRGCVLWCAMCVICPCEIVLRKCTGSDKNSCHTFACVRMRNVRDDYVNVACHRQHGYIYSPLLLATPISCAGPG